MLDTPQILVTDAQTITLIHLTIPRNEIQHVMGPGLNELHAAVSAQGIAVTGPWFTHHLKMDPKIFDFEICLPVASAVTAAGRVRPGELASRKVARTVYRGPYEGLGTAWGEFRAWLAANGHQAAPDLWECYIAGPESGGDSAAWQTQLNQPLVV